MRNILVLSLCIVLTGCFDEKNTATTSSTHKLAVNFKNSSPAGSSFSAQSATRIPILIGSLMVAGYYYRPGESNQMGIGTSNGYYNWNSQNWSQWMMISPSRASGRDVLLDVSSNVDLLTLSPTHFYDDVTETFIEEVGTFRMDAIYINAALSLININNSICGYGYLANKTPADFPLLDFFTPCSLNRNLKSSYDNSFINNAQIVSIRKDWFPVPIQIYKHSNLGSQIQCYKTDIPLTTYQEDIIDSLMSDVWQTEWPKGLYRSSCAQTNQGYITIIPHKSEVAAIQFSQNKIPVEPITTEDGEILPQPPTRIISSDIQLNVGFNMLSTMFVDYNSFNDSNATSDIMINRATDGSLFGISIEFSESR